MALIKNAVVGASIMSMLARPKRSNTHQLCCVPGFHPSQGSDPGSICCSAFV